ncbi:hypothetical protein SAMN04488020_103208 [Palleronia marisminoris]|uniref:Uncharacterized protein n=1 Tax=Palleronia marisminoris TaxID=315423 RepID=A0A1Y5SDN6_9RHOB|nr:hypothetical protein SAMN04488020_103208 [Palleronia marisminoris]SLN35584.1 hypothetical protein PAM7066_01488 [Palleronia marisminoris]
MSRGETFREHDRRVRRKVEKDRRWRKALKIRQGWDESRFAEEERQIQEQIKQMLERKNKENDYKHAA